MNKRIAAPVVAPDLSIVVVSYNTCELTLKCLRSVYDQTHVTSFDLTVVDNASADGSIDRVREEFPSVRAIALCENYGFGRAVNHGAAHALGRYVLLLNPDTLVLDGALDRLVALADAAPGARLYGGVTLNDDRSVNPSSCWNRPTPWSIFCQAVGLTALFPHSSWLSPQTVRLGPSEEAVEVDIVSGGFLLVDRVFWQELGGFDPTYFFYGEDFDLCLRAGERGARPIIFPAVRIVHHGGRSPLPNAERLTRFLSAEARLIDAHWGRISRSLGKALLLLWIATRRIGYRIAVRSDLARTWDEVWRRKGAVLRSSVSPAIAPIREVTNASHTAT